MSAASPLNGSHRYHWNRATTVIHHLHGASVYGTHTYLCTLAAKKEDDVCRTLNGFAYAYNFNQNKRHLSVNFNGERPRLDML